MQLKKLFATKKKPQLTDEPLEADVVIIIDVSFLAYKSAYALKSITTRDGTPSGHNFGATRQILTMLKDYAKGKTACLVFVLDGKPVHRLEIYPEYKAGRTNKLGYNPVQGVAELCKNIRGVMLKNQVYEADDVIAAFVHDWKPLPNPLLFTKDRDLWQLIPHVKIIYDRKLIGEENVREEFKVQPGQIPIHKAVFGDASDNIPRIPRVRSAYLLPLVQYAKPPEDFFPNLENREKYEITDKTREKILGCREQVERNFKLTQLVHEIGYTKNGTGNARKLKKMFEKYECESLTSEIEKLT